MSSCAALLNTAINLGGSILNPTKSQSAVTTPSITPANPTLSSGTGKVEEKVVDKVGEKVEEKVVDKVGEKVAEKAGEKVAEKKAIANGVASAFNDGIKTSLTVENTNLVENYEQNKNNLEPFLMKVCDPLIQSIKGLQPSEILSVKNLIQENVHQLLSKLDTKMNEVKSSEINKQLVENIENSLKNEVEINNGKSKEINDFLKVAQNIVLESLDKTLLSFYQKQTQFLDVNDVENNLSNIETLLKSLPNFIRQTLGTGAQVLQQLNIPLAPFVSAKGISNLGGLRFFG